MNKFIFITCIFIVNTAIAIDQKDVSEFFQHYQELSKQFSEEVALLYADDAKITSCRHYPNGTSKDISMTGAQLKAMLPTILPMAKSRGDINEYSQVAITIEGDEAKIKAHRYSVLKKYTDRDYYMVLSPAENGSLVIIEEHLETQLLTKFSSKGDEDIYSLLKIQKNRISEYLPMILDEDTRLDAVEIRDSSLVYIYTLVRLSKKDLDAEAFDNAMQEIVVEQSFSNPELKHLLKKGAVLVYLYKDQDGQLISEIPVSIKDGETE